MSQHTIIVNVPDGLLVASEEIEQALTASICATEVTVEIPIGIAIGRRYRKPFSVIEYHHERLIEEFDEDEPTPDDVMAGERAPEIPKAE